MKKLFLAALLVFALTMPAFAGDSGFYMGLKLLDSYQSTGNVSTHGGAVHFSPSNHSQNTLGGAIALGYDFYPKGNMPIRAEIEYALRSAVNSDYDGKGNLAGRMNLKGEYTMHTLFANAYYDFHNSTDFTPYIGGGLGLAIIKSKYELELYTANGGSDSYNETATTLAYNLGCGFSYDFTDTITGDFAYRFVGTGYHETDKSLYGQKIGIGMANYANEFSVGLRFNF